MHLYDAVIIGSGYSSVGFALKNGNSIIIEENQCADPNFYLPLKNFSYTDYDPVTDLGKKLNSVFEKYNLFKDGYMCTNALEPAFCEFLINEDVEILLKARVVNCKKLDDGTFEVTVITSEGLITIHTKNLFDTRPSKDAKKYLTVLSMTEEIDSAISILSNIFEDATFEKAFYDDRFAMHLPVENTCDVNEALIYIHDKWLTAKVDAKILYVAPVFFTEKDSSKGFPKDYNFSSPIEAFEAGIFFQGGAN